MLLLRRSILCLLIILFCNRTASALPQYAYRIWFSDKAGSPSLSNPLLFLSQRALDRRTQQGIVLNSTDQPVSAIYVDSVLTISQGILHETSRWLNTCVILVNDTTNIATIRNTTFVTGVDYIAYYSNGLHNRPVNNGSGNQIIPSSANNKITGSAAYYGATWSQTNMVHGDCLHDNGFKGQGKIIAVIDDGFHYVDTAPGFDSLYSSGRIVDHNNFVYDTSYVYDYDAHGTEVLSTIAGYIPNTYVGAAPLAQFALYITEDVSSEQPIEMDNMVAAFERADSIGADVITSSLGYNDFTGPVPYSTPFSDMDGETTFAARGANLATTKGMLLIITAGNEGPGGLLTPGDADSVITVGSVDVNGVPAGSSGYGPNAAGIIKPDLCTQGQPGYVMQSGLGVYGVNGTSISTPQIAGFAACLWQSNSSKKNYEVKNAIVKHCSLYTNPSTPQLGYGIPNFCSSYTELDVKQVLQNVTNIQLYPNPAKDELNIAFPTSANQPLEVVIFDITGKIIQQYAFSSHEKEVKLHLSSAMASGIYFCKLIASDQVNSFKFIKE